MNSKIRNELPTDTVLDENDTLSQVAIDSMKAIYLAKAETINVARNLGWTPTEIIDGMEELRQAGLLRIEIDGEYDNVRIAVLSPAGEILKYI